MTCLNYLLHSVDRASTFTQHLLALLAKYSQVDPAAIGFTRNWHQEPLWQK